MSVMTFNGRNQREPLRPLVDYVRRVGRASRQRLLSASQESDLNVFAWCTPPMVEAIILGGDYLGCTVS